MRIRGEGRETFVLQANEEDHLHGNFGVGSKPRGMEMDDKVDPEEWERRAIS